MIPGAINKAERLFEFLKINDKSDFVVEVDGNITFENAYRLKKTGAKIFVAGSSSIFRGDISNYGNNIKRMRQSII